MRDDVLATDPDTLFPLQAALGYDVTQTLFIGRDTLLVEGPGTSCFSRLFLSSYVVEAAAFLTLDGRFAPRGDRQNTIVCLAVFGANLEIAVVTDFAENDRKKLENLRKSGTLKGGKLMTFAEILEVAEADVEDISIRISTSTSLTRLSSFRTELN